MSKILFIDSVHPILEERLTQMEFACEHDYSSPKEMIETKITNYIGIVIRSRFTIDKSFLDKASKLKFIARSGAGLENIDIAYAAQKNIKVFNSPEGNKDAVGEHAIGMLLMLFNKLKQGDAQVRGQDGSWHLCGFLQVPCLGSKASMERETTTVREHFEPVKQSEQQQRPQIIFK